MMLEKILIALGLGAALKIHNEAVHEATNRVTMASGIASRMERRSGRTFDGIVDRRALPQQRASLRQDTENLRETLTGILDRVEDREQ